METPTPLSTVVLTFAGLTIQSIVHFELAINSTPRHTTLSDNGIAPHKGPSCWRPSAIMKAGVIPERSVQVGISGPMAAG